MQDPFRYHRIADSSLRVLNPLAENHVRLLGDICRLRPAARHLDLASAKGEVLCQYAALHGTTGVGVDIDEPFVDDARARAAELGGSGAGVIDEGLVDVHAHPGGAVLGVADKVRFVVGDAATYPSDPEPFDVVSCIGATWIGGGLTGTLDLMRPFVTPDGLLLVGECYWIEPPPAAEQRHLGGFTDLPGTFERSQNSGADLIEMVLATQETWDRHQAERRYNTAQWLDANPDDPEVEEIRHLHQRSGRDYLAYERRCLGWGVFVLQAPQPHRAPRGQGR